MGCGNPGGDSREGRSQTKPNPGTVPSLGTAPEPCQEREEALGAHQSARGHQGMAQKWDITELLEPGAAAGTGLCCLAALCKGNFPFCLEEMELEFTASVISACVALPTQKIAF